MNSLKSAVKMPEIGRNLIHKEGVELISKWISSLKRKLRLIVALIEVFSFNLGPTAK